MASSASHYFPHFMWELWLSKGPLLSARSPRLHIYDVCTNELTEAYQAPSDPPSIFEDLNIGYLTRETLEKLSEAEALFTKLEHEAHETLKDLLGRTIWGEERGAFQKSRKGSATTNSIPFTRRATETLRKYFLFLRFRNSEGYQKIVESLKEGYQTNLKLHRKVDFPEFRPIIVQHRLRYIIQGFIGFLSHSTTRVDIKERNRESSGILDQPLDAFRGQMETYCWRLIDSEVCIGIATDDQEFILSDKCYGTLDEGLKENPECCDLFFPVAPTLALYILGTSCDTSGAPSLLDQPNVHSSIWLDIGLESAVDVHLRNACILQTHHSFLYFVSLRPVALSISSYDEFRWSEEHLDYSRLKQRCRQKFLQETVVKTLVVKGTIKVVDLTDDVVIIGDSAVAHGAFSDVWMGSWEDPMDRKTKKVALKFLRQVMVHNREKLLKRLEAEVIAWHGLSHKNVSQFFGIVQNPTSFAMVSQWCANGTICAYLNRNPEADRLKLLVQVASGIAYLHTVRPAIVHGDLKGGNVLIDDTGKPVITDFGLSKVIEEVTMDADAPLNLHARATSFFAGSTRWMAPELVMALVLDDGRPPVITTYSDVYAFASICLEVASGQLPYANRTNDHAVTVDIMRGIRPKRHETCLLHLDAEGERAFWDILGQCWSEEPTMRPGMPAVMMLLDVLSASSHCRVRMRRESS
ncbi:kinase-like protein [Pholiota conissans]|uniref:Kinase-like protein n=1 Tax=Pholiota conissans TaxID=109636 RepID=A0A9P5ZA31_9AGAR|nr:kinase-like protein [Pholiota conissans]